GEALAELAGDGAGSRAGGDLLRGQILDGCLEPRTPRGVGLPVRREDSEDGELIRVGVWVQPGGVAKAAVVEDRLQVGEAPADGGAVRRHPGTEQRMHTQCSRRAILTE